MCRVTADEGDIGRGHLGRFQDVDTKVPTILTTSQMLTTGVDAPTCKNVVLARVVGSMSEFKQIIGGARECATITASSGSTSSTTPAPRRAFSPTRHFDGDPALITEEEVNEDGRGHRHQRDRGERIGRRNGAGSATGDPRSSSLRAADRQKFYFDGGQVEIAAHLVYELDPNGKQLRVVRYTDYAAEAVRTLCPNRAGAAPQWADR